MIFSIPKDIRQGWENVPMYFQQLRASKSQKFYSQTEYFTNKAYVRPIWGCREVK